MGGESRSGAAPRRPVLPPQAAIVVAVAAVSWSAILLPLMALITPVAAVLLVLAALIAGDPLLGHAPRDYALFLLLALGPTAVGHTLLNWALRYMKAYAVNVAVLGEPVGATLLAFLLLGEQPPFHVVAGGVLVMLGVALAWLPPRRRGLESERGLRPQAGS